MLQQTQLLKKKYEVHGVKRRSSSINTQRVDHIYQDPHEYKRRFILHYGDITDSTSVSKIIKTVKPDEIYNLAAQSHVAVSFEVPEYTANADALGTLRILEAIKCHNLTKKTMNLGLKIAKLSIPDWVTDRILTFYLNKIRSKR